MGNLVIPTGNSDASLSSSSLSFCTDFSTLFQCLNWIVALPVFETIAIRVKQLRIGSTFVFKSFVFFDFQLLFTSCALHKTALRRLRCDIGDWRPAKQRSLRVPSVG